MSSCSSSFLANSSKLLKKAVKLLFQLLGQLILPAKESCQAAFPASWSAHPSCERKLSSCSSSSLASSSILRKKVVKLLFQLLGQLIHPAKESYQAALPASWSAHPSRERKLSSCYSSFLVSSATLRKKAVKMLFQLRGQLIHQESCQAALPAPWPAYPSCERKSSSCSSSFLANSSILRKKAVKLLCQLLGQLIHPAKESCQASLPASWSAHPSCERKLSSCSSSVLASSSILRKKAVKLLCQLLGQLFHPAKESCQAALPASWSAQTS